MDYKAMIEAIGADACQENMDDLEFVEKGNDFTWEIEGKEYRFIHESSIERIHRHEIEDFVDDCYLGDKNIPDAIRRYFDYDSFARDCRISDGYGHHFATYDGEEIEAGDWHIFRVN